jgi:CubicO group peptidase (beta-lactamase class C family)
MNENLKSAADRILNRVTSGSPSVPGVVAIATDRNGNVYEGAAGKRMLGGDADMTTDSVFAIFSTTKAIAGTACLQLVEDGKLAGDRQAAGAGGLRLGWQAQAAPAEARRHDQDASAAHRRLRLRLLQ